MMAMCCGCAYHYARPGLSGGGSLTSDFAPRPDRVIEVTAMHLYQGQLFPSRGRVTVV